LLGHDDSISPTILMTDCTSDAFNGLSAIFKKLTISYWCSWHTIQCFRRHICNGGKDRKTRFKQNEEEIFRSLLNIMEEKNESVVRTKIKGLLLRLGEMQESEVATYLSNHWFTEDKLRRWAFAFRDADWVNNTNNVLESFHRVLKVCFFCRMKVHRIERLLMILLDVEQEIYRRSMRLRCKLTKKEAMRSSIENSFYDDDGVVDHTTLFLESPSKEKAHRLGRKRKRMLELANRVAELIPHMAAVSDPEHESVFDTGIKLLSDFNHHVGAFLKFRLMNKDVESSTFKSKKTLHMPGMRLDQPSKDLKCYSTAFTRNKKPGRKRRKLSSRGTIEEQDRVGEQLELYGL